MLFSSSQQFNDTYFLYIYTKIIRISICELKLLLTSDISYLVYAMYVIHVKYNTRTLYFDNKIIISQNSIGMIILSPNMCQIPIFLLFRQFHELMNDIILYTSRYEFRFSSIKINNV